MPGIIYSDSFRSFSGAAFDLDGTPGAGAHTPEIGQQWQKHPASSIGTSLVGGRVRPLAGTSLGATYWLGNQLMPAEYLFEIDFVVLSLVANFPGIFLRMSNTVDTGYLLRTNIGGNTFDLIRVNAGAGTTLHSVAKTWAVQTYRIGFQCLNASKKGFIDGSEIVTSADNTLATGYAGLRLSTGPLVSDVAGVHLDNMLITDLSPALPAPPLAARGRARKRRMRHRRLLPVTATPLPSLLNQQNSLNGEPFTQDNLVTDVAAGVQYAVYWDSLRNPWISKRTIGASSWSQSVDLSLVAANPLKAPAEEDPHNTINAHVSSDGHIHVIGNQHANPLRYIRTITPGDITAWTAPGMVGTFESTLTYPQFVKCANGDTLLFYRDGVSGNADSYLNRYNPSTHTWSRVAKFVDGLASGDSVYFDHIPVAPDGTIGVSFSWRASGPANTTNDVGYVKSTDNGATWKNAAGGTVTLPITHASCPLALDTAAQDSGILNSCGADFDTASRYHTARFLYDGNGKTQINHIWYDGAAWHNDVATSLTYRIDLTVILLDAEVTRPMVVCDASGRTFIVYRSNPDKRGRLNVVDVTPPPTVRLNEFSIWNTDLFYQELSHDTRAAKDRDELSMLLAPAASVDPNKADQTRMQWNSVQGWVLSVPMSTFATLAA